MVVTEEANNDSVAVFWGQSGEHSASITTREANEAATEGNLAPLDYLP